MMMAESVRITNFSDTLYFSRIENDTFCEYRLPGHGLMWVRSGRMEIESPQGTVTARAGQFIFWQRDCTSTMRKLADGDTPFTSIAIALPRALLKEYFRDRVTIGRSQQRLSPIGGVAVLLPETIQLESLFYSLMPYCASCVEPSHETIGAKVFEALSCLLRIDERFYPTLFDFHETWKIDLYEFMKAHFAEDLSIEDFAHYSGRSLATFKRDFAKISDLTPQKWLIEQRLLLAARLIANGANAGLVYEQVGFRNKAHFFTAFKIRFGCTPLQYQQNSGIWRLPST